MDERDWDDRYRSSELYWGHEPNRWVAAELETVAPGRGLDVACGEGRNAIWLAARGWHVTGVDFSAVAVERAAALAEAAGVSSRTTWECRDVVRDGLPGASFDAVVVAYLQLPAEQRRSVLRACAAALAPGGVLVVVGHDSRNLADGYGGPRDAAVLFGPEDVVADLADIEIVVERADRVLRPVETPEGSRDAIDALVRVRRSASPEGR